MQDLTKILMSFTFFCRHCLFFVKRLAGDFYRLVFADFPDHLDFCHLDVLGSSYLVFFQP